MFPTITLSSEKTDPLFHPWVFPKSIEKQDKNCVTGELVRIVNASKEWIATGFYNEHSLYRVRIVAYAPDTLLGESLDTILYHRLQQAMLLRHQLNLPNIETTAYRLCNSEADGLSGLTIDCFNQTLVISSTAFWVEKHRLVLLNCLQKLLPTHQIFWLPQEKSLAQDGWSLSDKAILPSHEEVIREGGVLFQINFSHIQKTGLFIDQRENHQRIALLAKNKKILDLYTYTGGFALHAAKADAAQVVAIDSSAAAIELAQHNATLNDVSNVTFIEADARDYLSTAGDYDIILLDPPKLVPSKKHLEKAKNYYRFLHRETFKAMQPGSLLMTCNCSSALSNRQFSDLVATQARAVGKNARLLGNYGPALCHPILPHFPEGQYLSALLFAVV